MGLTISHGAYDGFLHQFDRLRRRIAEAIGVTWPSVYGDSEDRWYWGDADPEKYRGLEVFLNHSDVQGRIRPRVARRIARELRSIKSLRDDEEVQQLRKGCRRAWRRREKLVFS